MSNLLLYFLTLVTASQGFVLNVTAEVKLPVPRIYGLAQFDANSPTVLWLPVQNKRNHEPVIGYKVKMWEVGCVKKRRNVIVDDTAKLVEELVMPRLQDYSTLRNLQEFTLEGVENSTLYLKELSKDIPYHIRVSAYSISGVGPSSLPFRFQLAGTYKCREY